MEEEKMNLRLDIDVQKLETEKLRKGKNKAEEELDSLKKFQEVQTRNEALEKSLSKSQKEKVELNDRVIELERSLRQYRNRNFVIELRASLSKIEEMKKRIEELETTLRNCEIRIECLEAIEIRNNEQLHYFQNQVRSRDHIMEEAVIQIQEVADHIQTLAVQADILSVKYELESDRGQELALLFRKIRILSNRAKLYL
ncbi:coiled-coil domain-containing protein 102A-like [Gossypium hirsutum]|uniref:Coiled-coil domain-containing protein 102A-like n=1 Tax=Gossypium hirsutum TaxID=3635 RepID=A0A1U8IT48_GOSHI|nr:coiled-coil domain-containing protein 102A-like [Gossypium hirsutum]